MLTGPDLDEVRRVADAVRGTFVYSAGSRRSRTCAALAALRQVNLAGVIVGKALYEGASPSPRRRRAEATEAAPTLAVHYKRVIPCLDVDAGRVVKGIGFVDLRDAGDPVELAAATTPPAPTSSCSSTSPRPPTSARPSSSWRAGPPTTCSSRSRSAAGSARCDDAQAVLDAGADKVSVNSAALARPELIDELARTFGAQCVVLAIDAKARPGGGWEAYVAGGRTPTGRDAVAWAREAAERGAGEILLTSMDRDGTNAGYDLKLTEAVAEQVGVPVIASGGAGELDAPRRRGPGGRRRGAVRLDLPLRPPHGGRGQGAHGRRRDPGPPGLATSSAGRRSPAHGSAPGSRPRALA